MIQDAESISISLKPICFQCDGWDGHFCDGNLEGKREKQLFLGKSAKWGSVRQKAQGARERGLARIMSLSNRKILSYLRLITAFDNLQEPTEWLEVLAALRDLREAEAEAERQSLTRKKASVSPANCQSKIKSLKSYYIT